MKSLLENILALILIIFFALVFMIYFVRRVMNYISVSNYYKMEMRRSSTNEEYEYWKKEYRRHLPVVGRFIRK